MKQKEANIKAWFQHANSHYKTFSSSAGYECYHL